MLFRYRTISGTPVFSHCTPGGLPGYHYHRLYAYAARRWASDVYAALVTLDRHATLADIAAELNKIMAQVVLNWGTARSRVIAIPTSDHSERIMENCHASGWRLMPEQIERPDAAF